MAASSAMQMQSLFLASPVANRRQMIQLYNVKFMPRFQRNVNLQVRCSIEGDNQKEQIPPTTTPVSVPETPKPSPPPRVPKVSTDFFDVFAFSGPAPERINGRLAMVGFVAAFAVELSKGEGVLAQLSDGGVPFFVGTSILFTIASVIPLFQGVTVESKSGGFMSSDAELWNGRFAMLGLIALAFTEYVTGGALV